MAAGAAVLVLVILAVWLLPTLACAIANASLPRDVGRHATILALAPDAGEGPQPPLHMAIAPGLLRRIAAGATGWWIPPGVVREGLGALGTIRGTGTEPIPWGIIARNAAAPPRLDLSLSPAQADSLLGLLFASRAFAGFAMRPQVGAAELSELPPSGARRIFRIDLSGALHLSGNGLDLAVPVQRLVGTVAVEFTPAGGGWQPVFTVAIEVLDAPLPVLSGLDAAMWRHLIAAQIQGRIAEEVGERTLPPWFPLDLAVAGVVR